eukprot:5992224-Pyramimonas_sp.AAC.1
MRKSRSGDWTPGESRAPSLTLAPSRWRSGSRPRDRPRGLASPEGAADLDFSSACRDWTGVLALPLRRRSPRRFTGR